MISYEHFTLSNGLRVYVHQDHTTPMAVVNILYNVGARDEPEHKTGFAHLFEHLMFGGSKNIPVFDEPLQRVGAENNAFTSNDITNYYVTLPAKNLETAFWAESDRMMSLSFDPKVLDIQRNVVIEEFKQRYLNQPYGDVWLKLRPLAYQKHPYRWATIGKEISHIENATMDDVRAFFYKFYLPNNAIMVVAGNVTLARVRELSQKWFEPIPAGAAYQRNLPQEATQTEARFMETSAKVPLNAIYKTYAMPGRFAPDFAPADLLNDVLGRGKSARLYQKLIKQRQLFNNINSYMTSSLDPGLFVISGTVRPNVSVETANEAIDEVVQGMIDTQITDQELSRAKNQSESTLVFSEVELLNRAMNLAFAANAGNADWVNQESDKLAAVSADDIGLAAKRILRKTNSSTFFYRAQQ